MASLLWGDWFFDEESKGFKSSSKGSKNTSRGFNKFIMQPIINL
jgi:elongation factor 2